MEVNTTDWLENKKLVLESLDDLKMASRAQLELLHGISVRLALIEQTVGTGRKIAIAAATAAAIAIINSVWQLIAIK